MVDPEKILLISIGSKRNEPQINADERRFVASNPAHLICSWILRSSCKVSHMYVFYRTLAITGATLTTLTPLSIVSVAMILLLRP